MNDKVPIQIALIFEITTLITLLLFVWAIKKSTSASVRKSAPIVAVVFVIWLTIQAVLSLESIYSSKTESLPPKIMLLGIFPPVLFTVYLFITKRGKQIIDSLPINNLLLLNSVRFPVEIVLYQLFLFKTVPKIMTFEGQNFDILAGITAPLIVYFSLAKTKINRQTILIWNFICLGLLINIVVIAFFSTPTPLQKFGLEQPNSAVLYFPFCWLPTFIVPLIMFGHLTVIRQLLNPKSNRSTNEITVNG